jgi:uncharacterized protein (TIGR02118 family)
MIVVSVLYPRDPESKFDLVYYQNRHLQLCCELLTPMGMQSLTFYRPIVTDPGAAFQRFTDLKTTNAALAAHGLRTQADIPNFTDVKPIILIGEEITG